MFNEREVALINAGRQEIEEKGLLMFNMAEVAKRANYSRSALYQVFRTKNDLVAAICLKELSDNCNHVEQGNIDAISLDYSIVLRWHLFAHLDERYKFQLKAMVEIFLNKLEPHAEHPRAHPMLLGLKGIMNEQQAKNA